jgi:glycosyltransferase involved in cell wall biosynthesis
MNILFVGSWYPYPPDNGARARTYNLVRQLSRYHKISLLSFYEGSKPLAPSRLSAMGRFCTQVQAVPRLTRQESHNLQSLLEILNLRVPWITLRWNPVMGRRVRAALEQEHFDLVIVSQVQNLPLLDEIVFDCPVLLEQFEVGRIWNRVKQSSGRERLRPAISRALWIGYLRDRLQHCSGATIPSLSERAILVQDCSFDKPAELIPNGTDLEYYRFNHSPHDPNVLVYQGSLEYGANYDAVQYFMHDIMPHVVEACPGVRLRVTGRHEGVDLAALAPGGRLELTGYLGDVRPSVASASAAVVPLRQGAGSRLKILEAMALGTPVVATSKGIEGIEAQHGKHALVADDPAQFAQHVVRLMGGPSLRARLAQNARRLVEERYGWDEIGARLNAFCEQLVQLNR